MSAITWEHGAAAPRHVVARPVALRRPETVERPLRLTARGRRLVTVLAVLLALAIGLLGGRAMASSPEEGVAVDVYTVGAGETLWSIASSLTAPGEDVRDVVDELMEINELVSPALQVGQQLLVPVEDE